MKVAFLCRSISGGGAERQMLLLARSLMQRGVEVVIAPFYGPEQAQNPSGVHLLPVRKRGRWDLISYPMRLAIALRRERPDAVYACLPAANCLAAALKPIIAPARIVFGIRASDVDLSRYDRLSYLAYRLERSLAPRADLIIVNSEAGRQCAVTAGLPQERMIVIRNGIDVSEFQRDPAAGQRLRAEWGVPAGAVLTGIVARLDPMKGHEIFLQALPLVAARISGVQAVLVGDGPEGFRSHLAALAVQCGIADRIIWAGQRTDMAAVYSALDGLCLPSIYGEGTPNAVGEAMACEVTCIVSDVGDSAAMVGDTGLVVKPGDVPALAEAIETLATSGEAARRRQGAAARQRIAGSYSIEQLADATLAAMNELVKAAAVG